MRIKGLIFIILVFYQKIVTVYRFNFKDADSEKDLIPQSLTELK